MVTVVEFPVFVLSRDSGEMRRYQDIRDMERQLERIDVENHEYVVWDRRACLVSMKIEKGPGWLALSAGGQAMSEFQEALRRFADLNGIRLDREGMSTASAEVMFENVAKRVAQERGRMGWFKRFRRRF